MKKTLALVLAAVMTAGMTTVAFADLSDLDVNFNLAGATRVYADKNENGTFGDTKDDGYVYAGVTQSVVLDKVEGGVKIAVPIAKSNANMTGKKDDIKNLKVEADWLVGSRNLLQTKHSGYISDILLPFSRRTYHVRTAKMSLYIKNSS